MSKNHPAIPPRDPKRAHYVCGDGHVSSIPKPAVLARCPTGFCSNPTLRPS